MREPEELATAPDYRWRRLWNQFWIHSCVVVFILVAALSGDFFFIPIIATGIFYWFVSRKVAELDAAARGFPSPDFDDIVRASLERKRMTGEDEGEATLTGSGIPVTSHDERREEQREERRGGPAMPARPPQTTFGKAKPPAKKPVDLPRHRP